MSIPTYSSTLIEDMNKQALFEKSEKLQDYQSGIMSQAERNTIDRSLQEQYNIEIKQFYDLPEEVEQEYYGQAAQALELRSPGQVGLGAPSSYDQQQSIKRVREIYDQYTRTDRQELEARGIDPEGAPFRVQETLSDLPAGVDKQQAATLALSQEFPGVTVEQLDISFEPETNSVLYKDPTTQQYTTINPVGQNWMDGAKRWMKLEGDAILSSLVPGVTAGIATGAVTKSPALAQAVGVAGDVAGYAIHRRNTLLDLKKRGFLTEKDGWTTTAIWKQAIRDALPVAIGSLAGVALTRFLTSYIKRLPNMDVNQDELVKVIKEVYEAKEIPFYDVKSAVKYLYQKQLKGELPENMRGGDVPWESHSSEEILEMARRVADIDTPGATIRPTTPQIMLEATERLGLDVGGAPGKSAEVLQAALEKIRALGGPLATQVDDVLSGQEKQMVARYQKLIDEGLSTKEALKKIAGLNTEKLSGTAAALDDILSRPQMARVNQATNEIQRVTDEAIDSIANLTVNRLTSKEAGGKTRMFFQERVDEATKIIDNFYDDLGSRAGGFKNLYDPTDLIKGVKGLQTGENKRVLQSFLKGNSAFEDILKLPKLKKTAGGRQYKNISYEQIKGMIEDVNGKLSENLGSSERRVYNALKDTLMDFRSSALSKQGVGVAESAKVIDEAYSMFKETYKKGVINKIIKAQGSRSTVGEGSVMQSLLLSGNRADDEFVKSIINSGTPDANVARGNVQAWLKGELYALGKQADGSIDPSKITDNQLGAFLNKYGTLLDDYVPIKEVKQIRSLPNLINNMKTTIRNQEAILKRLKADPELGNIFDDVGRAQLSSDPSLFFNKLYGRGRLAKDSGVEVAVNVPALKRVVKILKGNNSKASKQVLEDLKMYAAADLDNVVSIKNSNGLIDPAQLRAYLSVMKEPLDTLYGRKFAEGLGEYERMLRYLMPPGGKQLGAGTEALQGLLSSNRQSALKVGNDLTRAYIGIFTRTGRFATAFLRIANNSYDRRLLNLMLNPDQITSEYAARKFFANPYVQMVARQWPQLLYGPKAPGDERSSSKKLEVFEEEMKPELIKQERKVLFNSGGRVSPSLMPLRYGL